MFGLPLETSVIVFGSPLVWIVYTLIFLWRSRNWAADEAEESVDSTEHRP